MKLYYLLIIFAGIAIFLVKVIHKLRLKRRYRAIFKDVESVKERKKSSLEIKISELNDKWISWRKEQKSVVSDKLIAAGFYNPIVHELYEPVRLGCAIIIPALFYFVFQIQMPAILLILAILFIPRIWIELRGKSVTEDISLSIPTLMELMAVSAQVGITIENTLGYLSAEMSQINKHLGYMLSRLENRVKLIGLEPALDEMNGHYKHPDILRFVSTLKQSSQFGASIYKPLLQQATELRELQLTRTEEKAGKLSAKMSVPLILFIMLPVLVLIVAPPFIQLMASGGLSGFIGS
ncbi:type II secretion system F family protein [Dongshaea marina]|uniref:type II secretion system F family protein n=1 Tax=Dongshaea marina TaxID=2047966 RepID=UPI000D3E0568|nr:type II secretion system F family protein [Dongshaea marina]